MKWIKCSDRLPDTKDEILVRLKHPIYGRHCECVYDFAAKLYLVTSTRSFWPTNYDWFYRPEDVTHWMPIPEPSEDEK